MAVNETRDSRPKSPFLVAPDPDEIPVRALETCRQCSTETCSGANSDTTLVEGRGVGYTSEFEFTSPECSWRVIDETAREVALDTGDEVVIFGVGAFAVCGMNDIMRWRVLRTLPDNTKGVILHDTRTADATKETLLHTAFEANDRYLWRRQFNVDWHFAHTNPGESDPKENKNKKCLHN